MWDAVDPFARTLLNGGGASTLKRFGKDALSTLNTLARLPQRLDSLATRAERGELVMRNPELEQRVRSLDSSVRRGTSAIIFVGLLMAGVILNSTNPALSILMLSVSVVPLAHALGIGRINR